MQQGGFFYQAFIYMTAAVIAVPIAKKLGLGSVLGYPHRTGASAGNDLEIEGTDPWNGRSASWINCDGYSGSWHSIRLAMASCNGYWLDTCTIVHGHRAANVK